MMYFWEMWVSHGTGRQKQDLGYFVYYRTEVEADPDDIPAMAVKDKMLGDFDLENVAYSLEITSGEYYDKMDD